MPLWRSTTLAHSSPPKTVRATPPPPSSCEPSAAPFWEIEKMRKLNAVLARKHGRSREASVWSAGREEALSCSDATATHVTEPHPSLPSFAATSFSVRESRSPSISAALTRLNVDTGTVRGVHTRADKIACASVGILSSPEEEAWSVGGTGGAPSGGLSVSAARSLSCSSSMCRVAREDGEAGRRSGSLCLVPATASARGISTVRAGTAFSVARAAQRMRETEQGRVSAPRTTRAFERSEHPRLGQSPPFRAPPTARARVLATPTGFEEGAPSEGVLVHTPRIRQSVAAPVKTKTRKSKIKKRARNKEAPVGLSAHRSPSSQAAQPFSRATARGGHAPTVPASSRPHTATARSASPAPCPPQGITRRPAGLKRSTGGSQSVQEATTCTVHAPSSSTARSPSVPDTQSLLHTDAMTLSQREVARLSEQASALRREVSQLESVRRALQETVGELVGHLSGATSELYEVEHAQARRALASDRVIRNLVADWTLQQNAMVERLALMEEEMMGL